MEKENNIKWVAEAKALPNFHLYLVFNDGCKGEVDCAPLIEQYALLSPLQDENLFRSVALDGWTVSWKDGTIDIAPEYLYAQLKS